MGTWLRVRGQVPITITTKAWERASHDVGRTLNRYIQEHFLLVFETVKKTIRDSFDDIIVGMGLDTGCLLTYNRLEHSTHETLDPTFANYDYSNVLVCFNVWDRYSKVHDGLRALRRGQKDLASIGVLMPLTDWDAKRLYEAYNKDAGTIVKYLHRTEMPYIHGLSEKVFEYLPFNSAPSAFHVLLKVGSDKESRFVLFDSGDVYVETVKTYDYDWSSPQSFELAEYRRRFEATKALESFNTRKPRTRKQKNKKARRLRANVGTTISDLEKEDD